MIQVEGLTFSYSNETTLHSLSFEINKGEIFGILGPNGSGKTTLLKLLSRTLASPAGVISINGKQLSSFSNKEYAQMVGVLPQLVDSTFSYSVIETVKMGRYAHQSGFFPTWSNEDEQIVQSALQETSLQHLQNKSLQELSGGELQRVFLARALTQQPQLLLLDEPTNHLDVSHQMSLFDGLTKWKREKQLTVVAIFHDLNLASLYCDRIMLLQGGKIAQLGTPKQVMQSAILERVYDTAIVRKEHPEVAKPMIGLIPEKEEIDVLAILDELIITSTENHIIIHSGVEMKALSSSLIGGGIRWCNTFVNRHVDLHYACEDAKTEMTEYLVTNEIDPSNTVGMMTAVCLEDVVMKKEKHPEGTVFVMVTAGTGNAIDSAHAYQHEYIPSNPGTINIFVLVQAKLTDAAFVQILTTATEAKTRAIFEEKIIDVTTKNAATGTSTDSICIAATQTSISYEYGGPLTPIGKWVGKLVYEATREAIQNYKQRKLG
ncbi:adenosylcobinamide amidohydrolase [Bacillus sp. DJP31]|uniref:adenosylcobinamide amidohydrolase n=1 Tax=Bacillus sp. DJP31 TaxID=3409789 RepID=UPI003BB79051